MENSLVSDTGHRLEHTCMLIYTWFCIIQTYQKEDGIPQIAISAKIMQAILANLTRLDDSRISQGVPIAKACLKKLKDNH